MFMEEFRGKRVALIGASHGIGEQMARQMAAAGARLSLADLSGEPIEALGKQLADNGVNVITTVVDVRDEAAVEMFAERTFAHFGELDYCFHNAGVSAVGNVWKIPLADWHWSFDVNVMGPVHSVRAFIPRMIDQDNECHFVITASAAGLITSWGGASYSASKHALIGLAETLECDLQKAGAKVKNHVVCPGYVLSNLHNSLDYRPADEWDPADPAYADSDYAEAMQRSTKSTGEIGMTTEEAVQIILNQLARGDFLILTHPQLGPVIEKRYHNLISGVRPGIA